MSHGPPTTSPILLVSFVVFLDLIPVSSTVIPELEMPDQNIAETDQQYMKAYYSLFKKKFNPKADSQGDKNKYKYKSEAFSKEIVKSV